jgi:hypothetical protein
MIDDLRDEFPENRSLAIRWIAYNKDKAGQAAIVKRAEEILADKNTIDSQANELADCALALGILGDAGNLDLVKRICKHFMSFAQVNDLSGPECNCNQLFRAYRGLALLGKKEEALTELERLYDHYSAHWEEGYFKIYHDKSEAIRSGKDIKPIDWVR